MNRIALMVIRNFWKVPWAYWKLCHYAKYTEEYTEKEKYGHIQYIFQTLAIVVTCDNPIGVVLKKELYEIPFLKQLVDCSFSFPMERENVKQSLTVIHSVIREIRKGRNYLIFSGGNKKQGGEQRVGVPCGQL